jgi:hypothetical protein
MSPITVSALVVILGIATSSVNAQQTYSCYNCLYISAAGSDEQNCGRPNTNTPRCTTLYGCYNRTGSGSYKGQPSTLTERTCLYEENNVGCTSGSYEDEIISGSGKACVCIGNLCNSATRGAVFGIAMVVSTGLALVMAATARLTWAHGHLGSAHADLEQLLSPPNRRRLFVDWTFDFDQSWRRRSGRVENDNRWKFLRLVISIVIHFPKQSKRTRRVWRHSIWSEWSGDSAD